MARAVEAAHLAGQWFGPFEAVVGHSFGGAVAVNAAAGSIKRFEPLSTARLVLIAAPNSMPRLFQEFGGHIRLGPAGYRALEARVEQITGTALSHFDNAGLLAEMPVPTLVIHAQDDREVPEADARAMAGAGDHISLAWANGLGHRRILSDAGVVAEAVGFVADRREPALLN